MEGMRTKRFALLLACVAGSTVLLLLYAVDPSVQPSLHSLVTETQTRISHWKAAQVQDDAENPDPQEKYLKQLGFHGDPPRLYARSRWTNVTLPVFVAAPAPSDARLVAAFLRSFARHFPASLLLLYDLGMPPEELALISEMCNASNCVLRTFDFDAYPPHVRNLQLFAYRPIVIQEVLNQAGAVAVADVRDAFSSGDIRHLVSRAERGGVVSWTLDQPTSALTHPRMFQYFHTQPSQFYFHRMVQPNHLLLFNTRAVHFGVMLQWVRCALDPACIAPIGAQDSGCRFDKKPLYRYSGCHRYDASALSVALGMHFSSSAPYAAREDEKFFQQGGEVAHDNQGNATLFSDPVGV